MTNFKTEPGYKEPIMFEDGDKAALAFIDTDDIVAHLEGAGYLVKDLSEWSRPSDGVEDKDISEAIARIDIADDGMNPDVDVICWRYKE